MAFATASCPRCGAGRRPAGAFCWQCYTPFAGPGGVPVAPYPPAAPGAGFSAPAGPPPGVPPVPGGLPPGVPPVPGGPPPGPPAPAPAPAPVPVGAAVPGGGAAPAPGPAAPAPGGTVPAPGPPPATAPGLPPAPAPIPPSPPPWARPAPPLEARVPPPAHHVRRRSLGNLPPVVRWLAGALVGFLAVVAVLRLTGGSGVALPDEIAGARRVENPAFEAYAESLAEQINTSGAGASYGTGSRVDFAVMAFSGRDEVGPEQRMRDVAAGPAPGITVRVSSTRAFTRRGSDFACAPFTGVVRGVVCLWRDDGSVGVVYDYDARKIRFARQLALEVHQALRG